MLIYLNLLNAKHIMHMGFLGGSDGKGSGRTPAEGNREWQPSILARKISWTEEDDRLQAQGPKESNTSESEDSQLCPTLWDSMDYRVHGIFQAKILYATANLEDAGPAGWIPGWGRASGVGNGNPTLYSCLGNPTVWRVWWNRVHGVTHTQYYMFSLLI